MSHLWPNEYFEIEIPKDVDLKKLFKAVKGIVKKSSYRVQGDETNGTISPKHSKFNNWLIPIGLPFLMNEASFKYAEYAIDKQSIKITVHKKFITPLTGPFFFFLRIIKMCCRSEGFFLMR